MVYQFPQIIQEHNFSCIEELKCDALENVLRIKEDIAYNSVNFLVTSKVARKLYTELLKAEINGFALSLFNEQTNEEVTDIMTSTNFVVISITNQGIMFVEKVIYVEQDWPNDFWYVEEELAALIKAQLEKTETKALIFTLS